jgi:hypothetical protein
MSCIIRGGRNKRSILRTRRILDFGPFVILLPDKDVQIFSRNEKVGSPLNMYTWSVLA